MDHLLLFMYPFIIDILWEFLLFVRPLGGRPGVIFKCVSSVGKALFSSRFNIIPGLSTEPWNLLFIRILRGLNKVRGNPYSTHFRHYRVDSMPVAELLLSVGKGLRNRA